MRNTRAHAERDPPLPCKKLVRALRLEAVLKSRTPSLPSDLELIVDIRAIRPSSQD